MGMPALLARFLTLVVDMSRQPVEILVRLIHCFDAADPTERQTLLAEAGPLTEAQIGQLVDLLAGHWRTLRGVALTDEQRALLRRLVLGIHAAGQPAAAGDPAAALRKSLKMEAPAPLRPEQRAVARSLVHTALMGDAVHQGAGPLPPNPPTIPGYRLTRVLGSGAFGTVYLGQENGGTLVAIKVLKLADAAQFKREVRLLSQVSGEHLVASRGHGELDGHCWIAMQYAGDHTLADLIRGRPTAEIALQLAEQVLRGLDELHRKNVIHRDLKPENAIVGDDYRVRLIDFGLSKQLEEAGVSTTMGTAGTALYMSPEQIHGQAAYASDVWAFGCVLFELLVGRPLFEGKNVMQVAIEIANRAFTVDLPEVPPEVRPVLMKCLQRDAGQRYPNAAEALTAFVTAATEARKRIRYERYFHVWGKVLDRRLLERFAEHFRGQIPADAVRRFVNQATKEGVVGLDEERLSEILPPIFASWKQILQAEQAIAKAREQLQRDVSTLSSEELGQRVELIRQLERKLVERRQQVRQVVETQLARERTDWEQFKAAERERQEEAEAAAWKRREDKATAERKRQADASAAEQRQREQAAGTKRLREGILVVGGVVASLGAAVLVAGVLGVFFWYRVPEPAAVPQKTAAKHGVSGEFQTKDLTDRNRTKNREPTTKDTLVKDGPLNPMPMPMPTPTPVVFEPPGEASQVKADVATYSFDPDKPTILVQKTDKGWVRLPIGANVTSSEPLVALPGSACQVKTAGGIHLLLRGFLPQYSLPQVEVTTRLLDCAVTLHQNSKAAADLTLHRGRLRIGNEKAPARVIVRFGKEAWVITFLEPNSEVGIDMVTRYTAQTNYLDGEEPLTEVYLLVLKGRADLGVDGSEYPNMVPPPGQAFYAWTNKGPRMLAPAPVPVEALKFWDLAPPATQIAQAMEKAIETLAKQTTGSKPLITVLKEMRSGSALPERLLAIYSLSAIDQTTELLNALGDEDPNHLVERDEATFALRRWMSRDAKHNLALYNPKTQTGILVDERYKTREAEALQSLLHGLNNPADQADNLKSKLAALLAYMRNDRITIRHVAHYLFDALTASVANKPAYNAAFPPEVREAAVAKFQEMLQMGTLTAPPAPAQPMPPSP